jgi:hypothetical protein
MTSIKMGTRWIWWCLPVTSSSAGGRVTVPTPRMAVSGGWVMPTARYEDMVTVP